MEPEQADQAVAGLGPRGLRIDCHGLTVGPQDALVLTPEGASPDPEGRSDRRPQLSDLRESGALEQDADVVVFIFREEEYDATPENKGIAELIIGKQRNGPTGTVKVAFIKEYTRFENLEWRHDDDVI